MIRAFSKFWRLVKTFLTLDTLTKCFSSYAVGEAGNKANGMPVANNEWTSAIYSYTQETSPLAHSLRVKPKKLTTQFSLKIPTTALSS